MAGTVAQSPAEIRMARKIANENTTTYQRWMHDTAASLGGKAPATITNQAVTDGIAQRAALSAKSIIDTRQARMASLLTDNNGDKDAAKVAYAAWVLQQNQAAAAFEASVITHAASNDLVANNPDLAGLEHCEPTDTAGLEDECDAAVAMGDVPFGSLPELPAHVRCPHFAVREFQKPEDASGMWFGGAD